MSMTTHAGLTTAPDVRAAADNRPLQNSSRAKMASVLTPGREEVFLTQCLEGTLTLLPLKDRERTSKAVNVLKTDRASSVAITKPAPATFPLASAHLPPATP